MNDAIRMQVSAFVDGELPDNEAQMLLRRMSQDMQLRQQVADYLATGRMLRGERDIPGMDRLRDRIAAEVGERPLPEVSNAVAQDSPRFLRPVAGVAIAATVALAAIFGLQQNVLVSDQADAAAGNSVAGGSAAQETYTVPPDAADDMLRMYRLSHGATSLDLGASGINSRLVSLQLQEGELIEVEAVASDAAEPDDELDDAASAAQVPERP